MLVPSLRHPLAADLRVSRASQTQLGLTFGSRRLVQCRSPLTFELRAALATQLGLTFECCELLATQLGLTFGSRRLVQCRSPLTFELRAALATQLGLTFECCELLATQLGLTFQITAQHTALDLVHEIGTVGRNLGSVEDQRSLAAAQLKKETVSPSAARRRMRDWAQVAEAILINLEMASASAEAIETLRQPLLDAADKALTRRREKRAHRADAHTDPVKPDGT